MKFIDTSKDENHLYLYIEAILGGTFYRHIHQTNGLNLSLCRIYLAQLISILLYLSEKGIIHRDIKANNVLLNQYGQLKLCDFGSAKILYNEEEYPFILSGGINSCPKTLTIIGTTHIIAPEMTILSKSNNYFSEYASIGYGITVDWWAVGILFMEMIYDSIPSNEQLETLSSLISTSLLSSFNDTTNLWNICGHSTEELQSQLQEQSSDILLVEDVLQKLLSVSIKLRWCIWSREEIFQHLFFQDINWNNILEGKCPIIPIDQRLGYLELFEEIVGSEGKDNDQISSEDQALFDGF